MSDGTRIEWTDATWNPIRAWFRTPVRDPEIGAMETRVGHYCEHVSPGCEHCYAETMNKRLGTGLAFKPGFRKHVEVVLDDKTLMAPLKWKKPRRIFVGSMTDMFADFVEDEWRDRIFAVMALCSWHTFQVLTKRAERMQSYFRTWPMGGQPDRITEIACDIALAFRRGQQGSAGLAGRPLPNVWLGVSAEDQQRADERIPLLLQIPAAVRFVSVEPLLGPIDLTEIEHAPAHCLHALAGIKAETDGTARACHMLDWVIVGGESGPGARPMHPDWARSIRDQCAAAGVPFFFKQHGEWREPQGDEEYDTSKGRAGSPPAFIISKDGTVHCFSYLGDDDRSVVIRVGKRAAGRLLDGVEHNAMPRGAAMSAGAPGEIVPQPPPLPLPPGLRSRSAREE
jgi:protein gp37